MQLISLIFADCPQCTSSLCPFNGKDDNFDGYKQAIFDLCTPKCELDLKSKLDCYSANNCLENLKLDKFEWNTRCVMYENEYCVLERLGNWKKMGYTDLNTIITDNLNKKNPTIPCTECSKKLFSFEKSDNSDWVRNMSDILNQSCGNSFMDNYLFDKDQVASVQSNSSQPLVNEQPPSNTISGGEIAGIVAASLFLVLTCIFVWYFYRNSQSKSKKSNFSTGSTIVRSSSPPTSPVFRTVPSYDYLNNDINEINSLINLSHADRL